jgi:tripartite-type tricarboxylate transporter receptor subunit TctC
MKQFARLLTLCALLLAPLGMASSQDYPTKPVRIVVGFAAGGSVDLVGRILAQHLSELWGQPVVVENRTGAGGTIGADHVAKAAPDGYTLLLGDISNTAIAGSLFSKLSYDPVKDFVHVTRLVTFPLVIVAPTSSSLTSLNDLVTYAKANPGKLRYSSGGAGTSPHIFLEMLNQMAGIKTEAVHYKGSAPALAGLLSGDVEFSASSIATARGQLESGKARALAVTSSQPVARMPQVPPVSSAVPGYEALTFHGLHAPANTPPAIIAKIQRDAAAAMQRPDVKEKLAASSIDVSVTTTDEFTSYIRRQTDMWAKVIRTANIRAD